MPSDSALRGQLPRHEGRCGLLWLFTHWNITHSETGSTCAQKNDEESQSKCISDRLTADWAGVCPAHRTGPPIAGNPEGLKPTRADTPMLLLQPEMGHSTSSWFHQLDQELCDLPARFWNLPRCAPGTRTKPRLRADDASFHPHRHD